MKKVLMVVHQLNSDPGRIGQSLVESGYELDIRVPSADQTLPATMDEHAAAVVFGGPMSSNDDHLPFIRTELNWIETALAAGKPLLGICLGAQMIARVLGATVQPHPEGKVEIGYHPIQGTPAGQKYFPAPLHVYQWHREGFELPPNAVPLAEGKTFPYQAFCYGEKTYGLQFHPEMTLPMIERWTTAGAEHLTLPGAQSADEQKQNYWLYAPALENWLRGFLKTWLTPSESVVN